MQVLIMRNILSVHRFGPILYTPSDIDKVLLLQDPIIH